MQVISKSELLQTLKEIQCQMYRGRIDGVGAVSWFSDIGNEQTVIDAKEVVHGRWEKHLCIDHCSVCHEVRPYEVQADMVAYWTCNYCPNCGAKMDLEESK